MQLQLECTQLDECEYIEMEFKEETYSSWKDSKAQFRSFIAIHEDDIQVKYKSIEDMRDVSVWRQEVLGEDSSNWELLYWTLNNYRNTTVLRDLKWIETNVGSFRKVWEEVQEYRHKGTFPEHPKDKKTLTLIF
jgi:hypothetical protein